MQRVQSHALQLQNFGSRRLVRLHVLCQFISFTSCSLKQLDLDISPLRKNDGARHYNRRCFETLGGDHVLLYSWESPCTRVSGSLALTTGLGRVLQCIAGLRGAFQCVDVWTVWKQSLKCWCVNGASNAREINSEQTQGRLSCFSSFRWATVSRQWSLLYRTNSKEELIEPLDCKKSGGAVLANSVSSSVNTT